MIISNKSDFVYIIFKSPGPKETELENEVYDLLLHLERQERTILLPTPRQVEIRELPNPADKSYILSALTSFAIAFLTTGEELKTGKKTSPTDLNTQEWMLNFHKVEAFQKRYSHAQVAWISNRQAEQTFDFLQSLQSSNDAQLTVKKKKKRKWWPF
ncbi:MAG: hypothetical protein DWQ04_22940 [Chloroflexi bacterium]|nr:MAG: hypothetical protein DWQ04_22940 [Chloroflexota bacterium]